MQDEAKRQIGDYEILERLGAGAMGEVYKVRNTISDRVEAMKIMIAGLAGDKQQLDDRFRREIKLVASLSHPHIAGLCTALTINGQFVMVMEYVEGVTFESLLKRGPIPVPNAVDYVGQAADALGFAHRRGIIHRDIKPANFMLMASGTVKLMDFGIAMANTEPRLTQTGGTVGTLYYMSPEQITGQMVDARSDLYSLGISLYELVTGTVPFKSDSGYQILTAHLNQAPRPPVEHNPNLPARLNEIILKLIAKKPEERFQTAEELRAALKTVGTAVEIPGFQNFTNGTVLDPAAFRDATMRPGPGGTASMDASPIAPDIKKVTPVPVSSARTFGMSWPIVAGLVLMMIGVGTAMTFVSHSRKVTDTKPADVAPVPQAVEPFVKNQKDGPKTPNGVGTLRETNVRGGAGGTVDAGRKGLTAGGAASLSNSGPVGSGGSTMTASGTVIVAGGAGGGVPPGPSPEEKERLDAVDHELAGYGGRADAYNNRLNSMQEQMRRQGLALRTDIATAQEGMNNNLYKAKQALRHYDAKNAEEFAGQAKSDMDVIESFLHPK